MIDGLGGKNSVTDEASMSLGIRRQRLGCSRFWGEKEVVGE